MIMIISVIVFVIIILMMVIMITSVKRRIYAFLVTTRNHIPSTQIEEESKKRERK